MAGQGRTRREAIRSTAGLGLAVLLSASGCTSSETSGTDVRAVQRLLDSRAAAVLSRDRDGFLAALAPEAGRLRAAQLKQLQSLADVPLSSWEYRVGKVVRQGARAVAEVELRYRIDGYDTAPAAAARSVELEEREDGWRLTADRAARGGPQLLWEQGDVDAVRGSHSLVLGVGQTRQRLRALAASADRAAPAVSEAWREKWAGRVVILVPPSLQAMGALLGAPAAGYRGIAAVTTGETGAPGTSPADRVIVNPEAYQVLGGFGQSVVLTHETTHVATRAHTSAATPLWLSEGFADWVAYRGTGYSAKQAAPELLRAVRRGETPAALPADGDFSFGGDSGRLARAYEGGWLACELIAEAWGEDRLRTFYRAVGAGRHRAGAVEKAMVEILGTTPADFTVRWRSYVEERLPAGGGERRGG
ncbi:hypothetical protein AB0M39_16635 [Streptomyces sp. NPDC051907]|uniref:hypothetical protein n=1 Tax=Streptomyces sp. NPDC051907 TaxID=3155284 RepID=UPI003430D98A